MQFILAVPGEVLTGAVSFDMVNVNCDAEINILDVDTIVRMLLVFDAGDPEVMGLMSETLDAD